MYANPGEHHAWVVSGGSAESPGLMTLLAGVDLPVATHPLEIAAALEASGCRDVDARELGWPDTFSLAEHLYAAQVMQRLEHGDPVIELPQDSSVLSDRHLFCANVPAKLTLTPRTVIAPLGTESAAVTCDQLPDSPTWAV